MKKLILTVGVMMSLVSVVIAEQVRGVVVDAITKEPMIGATVVEKQAGNGTVTDDSGRFSIQTSEGSTIVIRFVGYQPKEVNVDGALLYISMNPSYELEQLIIRGVRARADDPVAKTTIDKKTIKSTYVGEHPIFVLQRLSPSIVVSSESGTGVGNYGQIRLRGISQERINFTLNGAPLNDMIDQGVFFSNFTDITSSFESIQVQRGVGTSTTGAASYAGSINMESFNVSGSEAFSRLQAGVGSFGTYRTNFAVNTGVMENKFGFYTSYSRLWSDGYRDNTFTNAASFFLTGGYYGDKDLVRLTAFDGRSENGLGYYTIDKSILKKNPTYNNLTANDQDDFSQYMVQLQHTHKFNDKLSLSSTAYYGGAGGNFAEGTPDVDSVYVENYYYGYQTSYFSINYPLKNDHYGLISNLYYRGDRLEVSGGVHGYLFYRENREAILPDNANPYYKDHTDKQELALFARATYNVSDNLSLFSDLQFRTMRLNFEPDYHFAYGDLINLIDIAPIAPVDYQFLNPRVGIKYSFDKGVSAFASFGRSGREPTRIDLIGGFQLNADALGLLASPDFKPEYVNDTEVGINISKQRLALSANAFYMDFDNEIAPIGETISFGVQRRVNIKNSQRYGVESDWNYLIIDNLSFRGNLSYINSTIESVMVGAEEVQNAQHILTPNWIGRVGLKLILFENRLTSTIDVNHMSSSFMEYTNDPALTVPKFTTLDFGLAYQPTQSISINLQIRNVTNLEYYTYGAPSDVDYSGVTEPGYFAQPPRNFFLTTSITF